MFDNNFYINLAIKEAWKYQGLTYPNPAVGAVVIDERGAILSINAHQRAGEAHAEVLALRDAYILLTNDTKIDTVVDSFILHNYLIANHNDCFKDCSIFVTLEPCSHIGKTPSCTNLIETLGLKKVIINQKEDNQIASGGANRLSSQVIWNPTKEGEDLLEPFRLWKNEKFIFFKWAQTLNGSVDGGVISSVKSRELVHHLRSKTDLLVIGGNTVRSDRPTLDTRMVQTGTNPDILIVSQKEYDEFDKTIPLFDINNRQVWIEKNFDKINDYNNIMIEGGANFFTLAEPYIEYILVFISTKMKDGLRFLTQQYNYRILHSSHIGSDLLIWMKKEGKNE